MLKNSDPAYLLECLEQVARGGWWLDPEIKGRLAELRENPKAKELLYGKCMEFYTAKMTDRMTAGAEIIAPVDILRPMRNNTLASVRVFTSKRRSRYSYAV